jgi:hypothetical protein
VIADDLNEAMWHASDVLPLEGTAEVEVDESEVIRPAPTELKGVLDRGPVHWYLSE